MSFVRSVARKIAANLPEFETIKTFPDFRIGLLTSHSIDFKILCGVGHEPKTIAAIKRLVKPGMIAVDVGANIGWQALHLAARVGRDGKVVALEGSDWTYDRLQRNLRLNDFPWVETMRAAAGATDIAEVEIQFPRGYRLDGAPTAAVQKVPMVRLDTALKHLPRVDFIKSDTDGFEPTVFTGAMEILKRDKPILLFEVAPYFYKNGELDRFYADLTGMGYKFEDLAGSPVNPKNTNVEYPNALELVARAA